MSEQQILGAIYSKIIHNKKQYFNQNIDLNFRLSTTYDVYMYNIHKKSNKRLTYYLHDLRLNSISSTIFSLFNVHRYERYRTQYIKTLLKHINNILRHCMNASQQTATI